MSNCVTEACRGVNFKQKRDVVSGMNMFQTGPR